MIVWPRIKSLEGPELESHLVELDLSINHLQVYTFFTTMIDRLIDGYIDRLIDC